MTLSHSMTNSSSSDREIPSWKNMNNNIYFYVNLCPTYFDMGINHPIL
jgi:hypothetical protein